MDENTRLANYQSLSPAEDITIFSQYLSFSFYKENIDHFKDRTKDSINNFLKTVSEIEDEFLNTLKTQRMKNWEMRDLGVENEAGYMEENYWYDSIRLFYLINSFAIVGVFCSIGVAGPRWNFI